MNTALILIIGIPLIEIYLFIKIGSQIGAFNTVLLILTTAVVGVAYARFEGFNTLKSGIAQLVKNEMPVYEIISGATLAFAAFLLILPGFATDFNEFGDDFCASRRACRTGSLKTNKVVISRHF